MNKNDTGKVIANHDKFFRGSMERLEIAKDFFAAHLAPSVLKKIQLDTLMLESSTFIDEVHKELRSDILYSVTVDNKIGYLYLVVEHQSKPDKLMAFRLLNYVCRIWQRCIDQHKGTLEILPAVLPLVVYNGKPSPYPYSTHFLDCFTEPQWIREFLFDKFQLIDLTVMPDEILATHHKAAFMEWLEKNVNARDILGALESLNPYIIKEIAYIGNGSYFRFAIQYLLDNSEATDTDKAVSLLTKKLPEKGDDIMTIAQVLEQRGAHRGAQQKQVEIAKQMLKDGMASDKVSLYTGLSKEKITTLN